MEINLFVALRYLRGRSRVFLTFTNLLSFLGISFGVFSIITVSSVMNGFSEDMISRIIGVKGDIKIFTPEDYDRNHLLTILEGEDDVVGYSRIKEMDMLLKGRNNVIYSLTYGVDIQDLGNISNVLDKVRIGNPESDQFDLDGIIIGLDLSLQLNVTVGEFIQITSPLVQDPSPLGLMPRTRRFRVQGIFHTGLHELDSTISFISYVNAEFLSGNRVPSSYVLKTGNMRRSLRVAQALTRKLSDGYFIQDWSQKEVNLYHAMKVERYVMITVLFLMIILSAFNMIGNSIKQVALKKREIGLLKTIGLKDKDIKKIFVYQGLSIGFLSCIIGVLFSLVLIFIQIEYQLIELPVPGFPFQALPMKLRLMDFIYVSIFTVLVCWITTIIPAKKTTSITPITTLRDL